MNKKGLKTSYGDLKKQFYSQQIDDPIEDKEHLIELIMLLNPKQVIAAKKQLYKILADENTDYND